MQQPNPSSSRRGTETGWWVFTFVISMVALLFGIIAVVAANNDAPSSAGGATTSATAKTEYDIVLADLTVTPKSIEVPAGEQITLHVINNGAIPHDLKVSGTTGTALLDPGASETIVVGPFTETTQAWCTVAGHKAAGMLMDIVVAGAAMNHPAGGTTPDASTNFATIDAAAAPHDDWEARDPQLPPADSGTVHEINFDATETLIEVAPGVTQMMWTFNDTVPGPTLRGKVGDTFRVTLTNKGELGHSIDFHASKVAWNDEMRTLQPGESLVYEFEAKASGIWMYHCGTSPALHHIGNGMFGAVVIDPPDLTDVEDEFLFVQSELYLGPEGEPGDLTKMLNNEWDAVVFNGYHNQYKWAPIAVEANKTYRAWVIDDGPSENSSWHIVGSQFTTVYKEGAYLLRPDDNFGGAQAIDLQPAQGGFVEFSFDEDGLYPIVTHKFSNVGKGALGFFAVGDVDTSALTGH